MDPLKIDKISQPFKKLPKFSQILLGTDKPVHKTEASCNFKDHSPTLNSLNRPNPLKLPAFSLGSHQQPYSTTASTSFEFYNSSPIPVASISPSQSIHFGAQKVKKISTFQSEFTEKKAEQGIKLEEIKGVHNSCHFTFGSFPNDYKASSNDYRTYSTTPNRKSENVNNSVSVVLGNFKHKNLTETREKFSGIRDREISRFTKFNGKTTNFVFGSNREAAVATSKDTYKGEQLEVRDSKQKLPAKGNNIVLGKNCEKWKSSYSGSFEEKELKNVEKVVGSKKTNFDLGFYRENLRSLCQDSYTLQVSERVKPVLQDKIHVYMGRFKSSSVNNSRF